MELLMFRLVARRMQKIFSELEPMRNFQFQELWRHSDLILQVLSFRELIFLLDMNFKTVRNITRLTHSQALSGICGKKM